MGRLASLILLFAVLCVGECQAQLGPQTSNDVFWQEVESQIKLDSTKSSPLWIESLIQKKCEDDHTCLVERYEFTVDKFYNRKDFYVAIPLAESWKAYVNTRGDYDERIAATKKVEKIYGYVGQPEKVHDAKVELLRLYQLTGNIERQLKTEAVMAEGQAWYNGEVDEAIRKVKEIRRTATERDLPEVADYLAVRLKYLYEEFGYWAEFERLVPELENIAERQEDRLAYAHVDALAARGDLLRRAGNFDAATEKYRAALLIVRAHEGGAYDTWSELYLLHRLANLEWERGNGAIAESILDTTYALGDSYDLHDRAIISLDLRIEIAEAQGRYRDALFAERERQRRKDILDSTAAGFDLRRYELELGVEKLTAERERQKFALQLRDSQLNNTLLIAGLVFILCLLLAFGWYQQRSARLKMAESNRLISEQSEQLRRMDKVKSKFFANISHELRTPLTLLLGPINSLLEDKKSLAPENKKLLEMAARAGKSLRQLINNILDLTKMEKGEMTLHLEPTQLAPFFRQYFVQFESLAQEKNIDYHFQLELAEQLAVQLDREKCRRIIFNLLSNAFKFTPEGGTVSVILSTDQEKLLLEVKDSGRGIHPDDLPHVFDRYFQTNNPDAVASGGTGIGLALCAEYARIFNGEISVASEHGKGASFKIWFPVEIVAEHTVQEVEQKERLAAQPFVSPPSQVGQVAKEKRPAILVVEDNHDLQIYLRTILAKHYRVTTASNGAEACSLLWPADGRAALSVDLIISDLMMPVMDGYQLLERAKSDPLAQSIPFIMLTARAAREDRLKALRIGVDDYLAKPFDETELAIRIENLLAHQKARLTAQAAWETATDRPQLSVPDQKWLESFEEYVRNHLADKHLSVTSLALTFNLSESSLLRQIKRLTGLTPKKYLTEMRLALAREWLEERRYNSIGRVGAEVGYADVRSFSRSFRRRYGKLPSEIMG